MMDPLLKISGLNAFYGKTQILKGIDLQLDPAQLVLVAGPNGAGKTTLLKSILGLPQVTRTGSIMLNKRNIIKKKTPKITAMGVGCVPQGRLLFPSMSVDEHLRFAWRKFRKKSPWPPAKIYELFPELKERIHVSGTHLSGGEQRMMAIGQALVSNPALLMLDEPCEGLSIFVIERIENVCRYLKSQGMAILLVEQNLEMASALADCAYFMVDGKIDREINGDAFRNDRATVGKYLEPCII
jgi:branched-chain amino acid transport system ATP-binding protein